MFKQSVKDPVVCKSTSMSEVPLRHKGCVKTVKELLEPPADPYHGSHPDSRFARHQGKPALLLCPASSIHPQQVTRGSHGNANPSRVSSQRCVGQGRHEALTQTGLLLVRK